MVGSRGKGRMKRGSGSVHRVDGSHGGVLGHHRGEIQLATDPDVTDPCADGQQNNGEQGIDCGGVCAPCIGDAQECLSPPIVLAGPASTGRASQWSAATAASTSARPATMEWRRYRRVHPHVRGRALWRWTRPAGRRARDDGNTSDADGCLATCAVRAGTGWSKRASKTATTATPRTRTTAPPSASGRVGRLLSRQASRRATTGTTTIPMSAPRTADRTLRRRFRPGWGRRVR